jgi:hypothetical protein
MFYLNLPPNLAHHKIEVRIVVALRRKMEMKQIMSNVFLLGACAIILAMGIHTTSAYGQGPTKGEPRPPRVVGGIELDIKKPDLVPRDVMGAASPAAMNRHIIKLKDNIILEMTAPPFDAAKHRITECEVMGSKVVCLIDDKPVFGADWTLPKSELVQATVRIGYRVVALDVSCMFNPWFDKPDAKDFTAESVYGGYLVRGNFSDAAGTYKAEWLIVESSSVRTQLVETEH